MIQKTKIDTKEEDKLIFENVYFKWPGQEKFIIENCNFSIGGPGLWCSWEKMVVVKVLF